MMSQIWFFPSLLSQVTQDVSTHFLVCPDFQHVRPPCLPSPLPLVHLPGWLLELMLSAVISGLWYSPNHLQFSYAAITHSRGHFPGLTLTSLPWYSLGPMVQPASFSSCSKVTDRSDAKEVSKVSRLTLSLRCLPTPQTQFQGNNRPPSDLLCRWTVSLLVSCLYQFNHIVFLCQSHARDFKKSSRFIFSPSPTKSGKILKSGRKKIQIFWSSDASTIQVTSLMNHLPIPALFIFYPEVIMTMWYIQIAHKDI